MNEFLEREPYKFAIVTKEQNRPVVYNLKAPSIEEKQESVKAIRTILLEKKGSKGLNASLLELSTLGENLQPFDAWSGSSPSPAGSPRMLRRADDHNPPGSATTLVFDKVREQGW